MMNVLPILALMILGILLVLGIKEEQNINLARIEELEKRI